MLFQEVIKELRLYPNDINIIGLTHPGISSSIEMLRMIDFEEVIYKPLLMDALLFILARWINYDKKQEKQF